MADTEKPMGKKKDKIEKNGEELNIQKKRSKKFCTMKRLLILFISISVILLITIIFILAFAVNKKNKNNNNEDINITKVSDTEDEYDEFESTDVNLTYAVLTPKGGYDNIFIFLGGISEFARKYFSFFKSNSTFVPKGTKIYLLSGQIRQMQFMIDKYSLPFPVPGWFNVDTKGNLIPNNDFTEAKKSLELVLDEIDRIKNDDKVDYKNIYLGGFSQGAIMTNYILLNSRYELGGYLPFSGYVFDHDFSSNQLITNLTSVQLSKLEARKNYHILATHSFADETVFYNLAAESYSVYFRNYTDFTLFSFGNIGHEFEKQPIFYNVRNWLKKSMGK